MIPRLLVHLSVAFASLSSLIMACPPASYPNLTDRKTLSVTGGFTYSYINIKAQDSNPTFLLLHGFPSSVYDWRKQITSLSEAGYGILAPDLLGYGETDHPDDVGIHAVENGCAYCRNP